MMDATQAQAHLDRLVEEFAELLDAADLAAPVPSCPEWTVDHLVRHVGGIYVWAGRALGRASVLAKPAPGAAPATLAAWYRACAAELQDTLRATDPDAVVTTFDRQPGPASFWSRRQAHETAMHVWDLGRAVGRDVGYDGELAVDGIDEVVTVFFPRQVRLERIPPLSTAVALAPHGQTSRWVLSTDGTSPAEPAAAEISGPPEVLLLALWGRTGLDDPRLQIDGDASAAATVLTAGIVP